MNMMMMTKCLLVRDTNFQENPSPGKSDSANMIYFYASQVSLIIVQHNQYIPHVGYVCGATGVDFQEDPFSGTGESDKKIHCSLGKLMISTDESQ
jgi:hypothetical protein